MYSYKLSNVLKSLVNSFKTNQSYIVQKLKVVEYKKNKVQIN